MGVSALLNSYTTANPWQDKLLALVAHLPSVSFREANSGSHGNSPGHFNVALCQHVIVGGHLSGDFEQMVNPLQSNLLGFCIQLKRFSEERCSPSS
jgi:hypothetical protein